MTTPTRDINDIVSDIRGNRQGRDFNKDRRLAAEAADALEWIMGGGDSGLVGDTPQPTNQPTWPLPFQTMGGVLSLVRTAAGRIVASDRPVDDVHGMEGAIGVGTLGMPDESTFEITLTPDPFVHVDRIRPVVEEMQSTVAALQRIHDATTAEAERLAEENDHLRKTVRNIVVDLLTMFCDDEERGAAAVERIVAMVETSINDGPCQTCIQPLRGESLEEFIKYAALLGLTLFEAADEIAKAKETDK